MTAVPRLSPGALDALGECRVGGSPVGMPRYAKPGQRRICHLGVGAFHRSHQAFALHRLHQMSLGEGWGIDGIGVRAADRRVLDALQAQDGWYSLWTVDGGSRSVEVIGSLVATIDGYRDPASALQAMAARETAIVSLTVTEAGYCLGRDGQLDATHPDVRHDLACPAAPRSAPGMLVRALELRRAAGTGGLTALSCDNVIANGTRLRGAVLGLARLRDATLGDWIEQHVRFPCSMVDRITPAMIESRREALCAEAGFEDAAPVMCEPWFQWVVEDDFVAGRPALEHAGVLFTSDVVRYEEMKVGLLNGGHSALCHAGLLLGFEFVHDAVADPALQSWVRAYMREVAETLQPPPGFDLSRYQVQLIRRFGNAALADRLRRLAQDSREKFRQALLPTLLTRLRRRQPVDCAALAIALWMRYLRSLADDEHARASYQDADRDALIAVAVGGDARQFLAAAFGLEGDAAAVAGVAVTRHMLGLEHDLRGHLLRQSRGS